MERVEGTGDDFMLLSKRRILLIASFGIPLVALISAVAIWGFGLEISYVLLESAVFPPFKLLVALESIPLK
jgi:hypothetical protein